MALCAGRLVCECGLPNVELVRVSFDVSMKPMHLLVQQQQGHHLKLYETFPLSYILF